MKAWLVRTGRAGERDDWALANGLAGGGFAAVPDLTGAQTREDVRALVAGAYPEDKAGKINNFAAQLFALRHRIEAGDLVVMPRKQSGTVAIGVATGGYRYIDDPDAARRHAVGVDWRAKDLPRSVFKQDLLYSLGAFMTVCSVTRNEAAQRLEHLMKHGTDPGSKETADQVQAAIAPEVDADAPDSSAAQVELETAARDRISAYLSENFAGHALARIVAAILEADGYVCAVSDPGSDGGADILAGRGPLGLDQPWLVVQVKSEPNPVGDPVVQTLQGAMTRFKATQALLVAPGGLTGPAKQRLSNEQFSVRVWNSKALLDNLLRVYDDLPGDLRAELPLQQVWVLVE